MFRIFAIIQAIGQNWQEQPACPQCANCKEDKPANGGLDVMD